MQFCDYTKNHRIVHFFIDCIFLCGAFLVCIEFVTILLLFHVLEFWPGGMWDPSYQPGIQHAAPALEGKVLTTG